jgi:hypothetical protein
MVALTKDKCVDDDNDMSDACLNTIRCIVENCPQDVRDFDNELIKSCMTLLKYDPEYTYTDDAPADDEEGGWGDEDYGDEGGFTGAANEAVEDSSWKVRRSAIKIIAEIANVHVDKQVEIVQQYGTEISERLKERVDQCKIEIFDALRTILKHNYHNTQEKKRVVIEKLAGDILAHIVKQSGTKNFKVKISVLNSVTALASTLQEGIDKHIESWISLLDLAKNEESTFEPMLDALQTLRILFKACKHGAGRHFISYAKDLTNFML